MGTPESERNWAIKSHIKNRAGIGGIYKEIAYDKEMLRTERITAEKSVQHELDTYNELVPSARELSATIFIEYPEREQREHMLVALAGVETAFYLRVAGERLPVVGDTRGTDIDKASAGFKGELYACLYYNSGSSFDMDGSSVYSITRSRFEMDVSGLRRDFRASLLVDISACF